MNEMEVSDHVMMKTTVMMVGPSNRHEIRIDANVEEYRRRQPHLRCAPSMLAPTMRVGRVVDQSDLLTMSV